ncbi:NotI family restriction endonuclease [Burkholderia sp. S171]|uniref:NotI family restriction endonuclease n=1 Tax=Burkholderia sp. S171 TaxID=1641860 RepID=UPI00131E3A55|nr:NotI family restriction endonuclease [Burkholderia sp. S171]
MTNKVVELFGHAVSRKNLNWNEVAAAQTCEFTGKKCYKTRKSNPSISIGTCTVNYVQDKELGAVVICPTRLVQRRQIFIDCLHLLTGHEVGNELHLLKEVKIPGGNVDFFLVSVRGGRVCDFVGIELQTLDTSGTVWPERQRLLRDLGVSRADSAENLDTSFGMNWKMTSKTILVQMHHKIQTFEHLNKKLVLVVQDTLVNYMTRQFDFGHLSNPATLANSLHMHAYGLAKEVGGDYKLNLHSRLGTDALGIARCLGLQAEARVELDEILRLLQRRVSVATLFTPI